MIIKPEAMTAGQPIGAPTLEQLQELRREIQRNPEVLIMNRATLEQLRFAGFSVTQRNGRVEMGGRPVLVDESVGDLVVMISTGDEDV